MKEFYCRGEHCVPGVPFNVPVDKTFSLSAVLTLGGTSMQKFSSWPVDIVFLASLTEIAFSLNIYAQCPLLLLFCIKIISI